MNGVHAGSPTVPLLPSRCPSRIAVMGRQKLKNVFAVPNGDSRIGGREIRESHQPRGFANRELLVQSDEPNGFVPLRDEVPRPEPRHIALRRGWAGAHGRVALYGTEPLHLVVVAQIPPAARAAAVAASETPDGSSNVNGLVVARKRNPKGRLLGGVGRHSPGTVPGVKEGRREHGTPR